MVLLTTTPRILAAIEVYNVLPSATLPMASDPSIRHHDLYAVSRALLAHDPTNTSHTFTALLRGTSVYTPPPPPSPPKSPEYIALMAWLRREQEEREYNALISAPAGEEEEEMTWKEVKSQVSVIFNILLSTLATAAAVWKVAGSWDVPERMAAAFASALVVAVAEVVLFGGYVRRLEDAKRREGRGKETKGVVGVWEIGEAGVKERVLGKTG